MRSDIPPCPPELESLFKKEWRDPELQEEFLENFDSYRAYRWAEERGLIKGELKGGWDLESIYDVLLTHYKDYKSTKVFSAKVQARKAGKGRRGKEGTLKKLIRRAMELRNIKTSEDLYLAFNDERFRDEIDYPDDPLPWLIIGVNWTNEKVKFEKRSGGKEFTRTFSRISSTLSELKK